MNANGQMTVGFIGIGSMGGRMAANILKAGFGLVIHDVRREAGAPLERDGAIWADTPRALTSQSDVVITCLPSLAAIEEVALGADGIIAAIRPGQAYFEMSTNSLKLAKRLHAAFAERGAPMLDAPVSGGATGASQGKLEIWVGGDKAAYQRHEAVLLAMGNKTSHIGALGAGLVTKMAHNCTSAMINSILGEVFSMAVKAGAEPLALWQAIRQGVVGRRRTFDSLATNFLPAIYEPTSAALRILHKDVSVTTELAHAIGAPMPHAEITLADLQEAMDRGWAERDRRATMLLQQERAGVHIAVDPSAISEALRNDPLAPTDFASA
jgi:3-hydroxyisobutyrate dehydrogenase-like beta-hydroxyacid dehydrogenase